MDRDGATPWIEMDEVVRRKQAMDDSRKVNSSLQP
jgi:hypothetical protein